MPIFERQANGSLLELVPYEFLGYDASDAPVLTPLTLSDLGNQSQDMPWDEQQGPQRQATLTRIDAELANKPYVAASDTPTKGKS